MNSKNNDNMKSKLLWMSLLLLTLSGLGSCSSDDDESELNLKTVVYESNPTTLDGTWHMVSASYGWGGTETYQAGEVTVTFNEAEKTMKVEAKNDLFLRSGSYSFKTTTEKRRIYTGQLVDAEYQVMVVQYHDEALGDREVKYTYDFHDGMLFLDGGMASDGPGYYFKKPVRNLVW